MTPADNHQGRVRPTVAALAYTVLLALLWVLRPPLPQIHSLTGQLSVNALEEIPLLIAWLAATLALLRLLYLAVSTLGRRPSPRRHSERERLQRILSSAEHQWQQERRSYQRYIPPLKLVVRPPAPSGVNGGYANTGAPTTPTEISDRPRGNMIHISLLGPFKIDAVEQPSLRSACQQVIAYLALHPYGATRDELIEAIWPEQDPHKARQRFWQNVSEARRLLGDALIT